MAFAPDDADLAAFALAEFIAAPAPQGNGTDYTGWDFATMADWEKDLLWYPGMRSLRAARDQNVQLPHVSRYYPAMYLSGQDYNITVLHEIAAESHGSGVPPSVLLGCLRAGLSAAEIRSILTSRAWPDEASLATLYALRNDKVR